MKISEVFNAGIIDPEKLKVGPITIRDKKGKETKTDGMPDIVPTIMDMSPEFMSYQYNTPEGSRILYGTGIRGFITSSGGVMGKHLREYVTAAQLILANLIGITMEQMEGADGYQIPIDSPQITEDTLDQLYDGLNKQYPLGPVTKELAAEVIALAELHMSEAWELGDNYKGYISYVIIKGIGQYASQCQQIVEQEVAGPVFQVLQYRMKIIQQGQAGKRPAPVITDLLGGELNTKSQGKIVGLDGKEIKPDKIVN